MRAQVVVLFVEQEESVRRQLNRAQLAAQHNTRVLDAGAPPPLASNLSPAPADIYCPLQICGGRIGKKA
jgi:hypothetical protein